MTSDDYDGILLGAGHNSLMLQAYPGGAGLKTLCLEQGEAPGAGLVTIEEPRHPGFLHNTHSFFHRAQPNALVPRPGIRTPRRDLSGAQAKRRADTEER